MVLFYDLLIRLYYLTILLVSPVNRKARQWLQGRRDVWEKIPDLTAHDNRIAWFHCASLGEFEQGRPVMERMKEKNPDLFIVLSFFSPSGYELRKNYPLAGSVLYLPLDTRKNAGRFLDLVKPDLAVFVKYEFWYHYLAELKRRSIPVYCISAIFRPGQLFFRWYGKYFSRVLHFFNHLFVQDGASAERLQSIGVTQVSVAGDTRFDRVSQIAAKAVNINLVDRFTKGHRTIVAGSTWKEDEEYLASFINRSTESLRWIIAPHEISEGHLRRLESVLERPSVRFSQGDQGILREAEVLIIDNVGMLSSLYRYGIIAYIGGGFGKGIHNILEAAVYGMPVIFGPNHSKFREANELMALQAAFPVYGQEDLDRVLNRLITERELLENVSVAAKTYVHNSLGATSKIVHKISLSFP